MAKKRKKEALMGKALVLAGAFLKILQIIGAALGLDALSGSIMTLITSCILVGGLAVYAIERLDLSAAAAAIAIVGILGSLLSLEKFMFSVVFMMITFLSFAVMLLTAGKKKKAIVSVAVVIPAALLLIQSLGLTSLPGAVVTLLLCILYGAWAIGVCI